MLDHFINYIYFSLMFDDQIKQSHLKNEVAYGGMSMSAMLKYGVSWEKPKIPNPC